MAGLRGRDLANLYINRARAERECARNEDAALGTSELAIKADERYPVAVLRARRKLPVRATVTTGGRCGTRPRDPG